MICRACDMYEATTADGLCGFCDYEADDLDRVRQAYRAVRATLRKWEAGDMSTEQAMRYIAAIEKARPR